jgi:hypothetical protein
MQDDDIRRKALRDLDADVVQRAALAHVLDRHPGWVTLEDLRCEVAGPGAGAEDQAAVLRAVAELIAAGLLHAFGDGVLPSAAALRFDALGL